MRQTGDEWSRRLLDTASHQVQCLSGSEFVTKPTTNCRMPTADPNASEPNAPMAAAPKSQRRWLRFSLRSLLIVTLLFAVSFAWVAKKCRKSSWSVKPLRR